MFSKISVAEMDRINALAESITVEARRSFADILGDILSHAIDLGLKAKTNDPQVALDLLPKKMRIHFVSASGTEQAAFMKHLASKLGGSSLKVVNNDDLAKLSKMWSSIIKSDQINLLRYTVKPNGVRLIDVADETGGQPLNNQQVFISKADWDPKALVAFLTKNGAKPATKKRG